MAVPAGSSDCRGAACEDAKAWHCLRHPEGPTHPMEGPLGLKTKQLYKTDCPPSVQVCPAMKSGTIYTCTTNSPMSFVNEELPLCRKIDLVPCWVRRYKHGSSSHPGAACWPWSCSLPGVQPTKRLLATIGCCVRWCAVVQQPGGGAVDRRQVNNIVQSAVGRTIGRFAKS